MASIHKAMIDQLKRTPHLMLKKMMVGKLTAAGITDDRVAGEIAERLLATGGSEPIEVPDLAGDIRLTLTDEDLLSLTESAQRTVEKFPELVQSVTKEVAL